MPKVKRRSRVATQERPRLWYALKHLSKGYLIIPLYEPRPDGTCSCRRGADCRNPGKHPRIKTGKDHLDAATKDPDTIRRWWSKWAEANIGIVTGAASNLIVVDVDDPDARSELNGDLPATYTVRTHGDHRQYYLRHPGSEVRLDSEGKLAPGIHFRGDGGYVVAPGSTHASGDRYAVLDARRPVKPPKALIIVCSRRRPRASEALVRA